ncbi:hypothetical protein KQX54_021589 [Cotesia glomerata]|uniref:Uncharacterized protein n=1 Tax=Cotesia glomerata TaxID=32391 RepID=A0AAV7IWG2_COTGL|nr:hypothetical protein KQX54_021589 [Cotesia glomerata]
MYGTVTGHWSLDVQLERTLQAWFIIWVALSVECWMYVGCWRYLCCSAIMVIETREYKADSVCNLVPSPKLARVLSEIGPPHQSPGCLTPKPDYSLNQLVFVVKVCSATVIKRSPKSTPYRMKPMLLPITYLLHFIALEIGMENNWTVNYIYCVSCTEIMTSINPPIMGSFSNGLSA